jgi:hypothetical protein
MHGFYNGCGQVQTNYYAHGPKMQGVFAGETPCLRRIFRVINYSPLEKIRIYESQADG